MADHYSAKAMSWFDRHDKRFLSGSLATAALVLVVIGTVITRDSDTAWATTAVFILVAAVLQYASLQISSKLSPAEIPPKALGVSAVTSTVHVTKSIGQCAQRVQDNRRDVERALDGSAKDKSEVLSKLSVSLSYIEEGLADSVGDLVQLVGEDEFDASSKTGSQAEESSDDRA